MQWYTSYYPPKKVAYLKSTLFCNPGKCSIVTGKLRMVASFIISVYSIKIPKFREKKYMILRKYSTKPDT